MEFIFFFGSWVLFKKKLPGPSDVDAAVFILNGNSLFTEFSSSVKNLR